MMLGYYFDLALRAFKRSRALSALMVLGLGLSAAQWQEALGIAEYHGPRAPMMRCIDYPTMVKDSTAWGAPSGVAAAYLAFAVSESTNLRVLELFLRWISSGFSTDFAPAEIALR